MASINQESFYNSLIKLRGAGNDQSDQAWMDAYRILADHIVQMLRPDSVLDTACGKGWLVKALRERGVEAWGISESESAILNILPESQPYCQVGSLLEPFTQQHYDLIICLEGLEQFTDDIASRVVDNLCRHSDNLLLAINPLVNVAASVILSPGYWEVLFEHRGFMHDLDFDASFLSPWAKLYQKTQISAEERLVQYEGKVWQLVQEAERRRELSLEYKNELTDREMELQYWKQAPKRLEAELEAMRNSTSWQMITSLQHFRERVIPLGSRREAFMRTVLRGFRVLRREGLIGFPILLFHRLKDNLAVRSSRLWHKFKLRAANSSGSGQTLGIDSAVVRPKLVAHTTQVDIIICVHNALEDVKRCLASLLEHTTQPYHLILVDDGSDEDTAQSLREFASSHTCELIRSEAATGYPSAANRGMRASTAELLVLINSDTILTPEWLDRLTACIDSDEKIGMAGPLSNTASWQSVPQIESNGDWSSNPLPAGLSPAGMAQLIAEKSARLYLDMPLLNGFCLMIRRKLLDEAGLFDEENFGQGYGEEDDLILRARKLGWKMALADDVYIYHAQSKSYSSEKRRVLSEQAGKKLREKHGDKIITQGVEYCQNNPVLQGLRARAQVAYEREQCVSAGKSYFGKRLLFIVPVNSPGGGTNVIRSEILAMQRMGVKSVFYNLDENRRGFEQAYPDLSQSTIYGSIEGLEPAAQNYDAVIATFNTTAAWLKPLAGKPSHPILGYYVQGFEPWIYPTGSQGYKAALESYTLIDNMILFTKTDWTRQQVKESTGRESQVIGASLDIDLYLPRPRSSLLWPNGPLRIAAMIRPESPYREPLKTMQLLDKACGKYKGEVEIILFGTNAENPAFQRLPHDFGWKLYGVLKPEQVANLLSQVDIFVDYSSHQAMGLTAMEAMASGCAVIVPQYGGASSFAKHEINSLIVDTTSFDFVWQGLQRLIEDENLRTRLQQHAIYDICAYHPERAGLNILRTLFQ